MSPLQITKHAQRRYLERIAGVDFSVFDRKRICDADAVIAVCEEAGIASTYVEELIAREVEARIPVTARLRGSRCIVKGETARFIVEHGYVVKTVLPVEGGAGEAGKRRPYRSGHA